MKNRTDTVRRHIEALRAAQQDNRDLVQGYTKEQLVKGAQGTLRKIADDLRKAVADVRPEAVQAAANDLDGLAIGWGLFLRFMPYPSVTKSIDLYEALLGDIEALKASLAEAQVKRVGGIDTSHPRTWVPVGEAVHRQLEAMHAALREAEATRTEALKHNVALRKEIEESRDSWHKARIREGDILRAERDEAREEAKRMRAQRDSAQSALQVATTPRDEGLATLVETLRLRLTAVEAARDAAFEANKSLAGAHEANASMMAQNKHLCAEVESLQIALKFRSEERDKMYAANKSLAEEARQYAVVRDKACSELHTTRELMKTELAAVTQKYTSALSERNAMKDALASAQGAYTKLQSENEAAQRRDTETLRAAHHTNKTLTVAMRNAYNLLTAPVASVVEAKRALETVLGVQSVRVVGNVWFDGTRRAFVPAPDGRFVGFNGTEGFFTTDVNLVCDDRATLDLKGYPAPSDTARAEAKRRGWAW
jgi:hypothetical protein